MIKGTQAQYACFFFPNAKSLRWYVIMSKKNVFISFVCPQINYVGFFTFYPANLGLAFHDTDSKTSSSNTMPRKSKRQNPAFFFFFSCASQWAPQIAWGMYSEWGRPRSGNQLGKTVNTPESCLSASLVSSGLLYNIVFAVWRCFPAAERQRKRGRGEIRLHFVHLGNLEFRLCARIARWKVFFLFSSWQCQQRTTWFLTVSVRGSNVKPYQSYTMSLQLTSCDQKD